MFINPLLNMTQKIIDGVYFFANSQICFLKDFFGV